MIVLVAEYANMSNNGGRTRTLLHANSLRQTFASFDRDGNGTIDADELRECMRILGHYPSPVELDMLLAEMDTNGDGVISFEEFSAVLGDFLGEKELEEEINQLKSVFSVLDEDGNGSLDAAELSRAARVMGVQLTFEEAQWVVREIDRDGDGEVSFEEFIEYVLKFEEGTHDDEHSNEHKHEHS